MRTLLHFIKYTCTLLFLVGNLYAQTIPLPLNKADNQGRRQGSWTLYFDADWGAIEKPEAAQYYRIIAYQDDTPIGIVRDFYKSGKVQWEGYLLSDRPTEIYDGKATWYREDGSVEVVRVFSKGTQLSETFYNRDGSVMAESYESLNSRGLAAYNLEDYTSAVVLFDSARLQAVREFGTDNLTYALAVNNLGSALERNKEYQKALLYYREAKELRGKLAGNNHPDYLRSVDDLARMCLQTEDYVSAETLALELKAHYKLKADTLSSDFTQVMIFMSSIWQGMGRYQQAELLLDDARMRMLMQFGKQSPEYSGVLYKLMGLYFSSKQYEKADAVFDDQLAYFETLKDTDSISYSLNTLALAAYYNAMGQYSKLSTLLPAMSTYFEKQYGVQNGFYRLTVNMLTRLYLEAGRYDQLESLLLAELDFAKKQHGEKSSDYAIRLSNTGLLYREMGFYEKAESLLLQAIRLYEELQLTQELDYAISLTNLSGIYFIKDKDPLKLLQRVIEIRAEKSGKNSIEYAMSLTDIGFYYRNKGHYHRADSLFMEAKAILEIVHGPQHPLYGQQLNFLASLYKETDRYIESEALYIKSLNLAEKSIGIQTPAFAVLQRKLAGLYWRQSMLEKAAPLLISSTEKNLLHARRMFPTLSEKEKEQFYNMLRSEFSFFNSFVGTTPHNINPSMLDEMYNGQLATKGILFNANVKIRERIMNGSNTALRDLYTKWQAQKDFLAKAYQLSDEERKKRGIVLSSLEEELNNREKQLSQQSELFRNDQQEKVPDWKDIQRFLKKGQAAVEIIRFNKAGTTRILTDSSDTRLPVYREFGLTDTIYYAALIVTRKSTHPAIVVLKNGTDLEARYIRSYKNCIQFKLEDSLSYNRFWKPIADKLKEEKIKQVFVSPDGVYNSVNLNTLVNPVSREFVLDEIDVRVVTNTRNLIGRKPTSNRRLTTATLFGYPDYSSDEVKKLKLQSRELLAISGDTLQRFFSGGKVTELEGTKTEVVSIDSLLSHNSIRAKYFLGRSASEDELKSVSSPDILHIATHGFFLQNADLQDDQNYIGFDAKTLHEHPLLRSGLLLAGCQKAIDGVHALDEEDGILTSFEAMNLNLDNTELVVLSACETGLGEVRNGEGVYGLQRAFTTAGAKSLLMSLWKVDDAATQQLMSTFYSNWLGGDNKSLAFKKAQLTLRKKYHHPYYWGAFVLVGE